MQYKYFDNRRYIEDNNIKTTMQGRYVRMVYLNRLLEMLYQTIVNDIELSINLFRNAKS